MIRFQPVNNDLTDGYIVGKKYMYKGISNEMYINGKEYTFIGTIRCNCNPECKGAKLVFLGENNGFDYYEFDEESEGLVMGQFASPYIIGVSRNLFYTEEETKYLSSQIEI